jgi:bifunctional DNA-binding transcriptional regulator/antitoxin component of YhaV-PrlF toxin-antitoxin module
MSYALTVKSQVTVPKAIRQHLRVQPGESVDYEPLPDGSVRMFAVREPQAANRFRPFLGIGVRKLPTDEIMRQTRGEDWNR